MVPQRAGGRCDGSGTSAAALEQPSQLTNGPAQQLGGGGALVRWRPNHVTPVFVLETPDGLSKNVRVLGREQEPTYVAASNST